MIRKLLCWLRRCERYEYFEWEMLEAPFWRNAKLCNLLDLTVEDLEKSMDKIGTCKHCGKRL